MPKKPEPKLVIGIWAKIVHDNPKLLTREQLLKFQSLLKKSIEKVMNVPRYNDIEGLFEVKDLSILQKVMVDERE